MLIIVGLTFLVINVDSHNIISLTSTETSELLVHSLEVLNKDLLVLGERFSLQ
jgi:hypothetical protein